MTTITLPRATVEQALDALLKSHTCPLLPDDCEEAITALRAALAQQAEPVEQMPVGWLESPHGAFRVNPLYKMQFPSQLLQWQIALYTALPQQAEPLTIERLRDALVASRIIPPAAVEDPDEYDDGVTLYRIEALHRRIT